MANVPLVSSTAANNEPSQEVAQANSLIQSLNANLPGLIAALPAAKVTTGTAIETLMTVTLPGGLFTKVGQGVRVRAWGVNSADANAKTLTLAFGTKTIALTMTGSGNNWDAEFIVYRTGADTQVGWGKGQTATTVVAANGFTDGAEDDGAAITLLIRGTAATAGTMTLNAALVDFVS